MSRLIIAEKPSVANAIAPVIGANAKKNGYCKLNRAIQCITVIMCIDFRCNQCYNVMIYFSKQIM